MAISPRASPTHSKKFQGTATSVRDAIIIFGGLDYMTVTVHTYRYINRWANPCSLFSPFANR
jgi:hypothetical protein